MTLTKRFARAIWQFVRETDTSADTCCKQRMTYPYKEFAPHAPACLPLSVYGEGVGGRGEA
jgi:hypothetical protein